MYHSSKCDASITIMCLEILYCSVIMFSFDKRVCRIVANEALNMW